MSAFVFSFFRGKNKSITDVRVIFPCNFSLSNKLALSRPVLHQVGTTLHHFSTLQVLRGNRLQTKGERVHVLFYFMKVKRC